MRSDETKLVAFYGALVATFTVGWNVYRDLHEQARLKLSTMVGHSIKNGVISHAFAIEEWPEKFKNIAPSLYLTITNVGRRVVIVQNWTIRTDRSKTGKDHYFYPLFALPKALKEGEYVVEHTDDLSLLLDGAKQIYAWDSCGKKWSLPRHEFRKLREEVRNIEVERQAAPQD